MPHAENNVIPGHTSEESRLVYERASKALLNLRQSDPELQRLLRVEVARSLFGEDSNAAPCKSTPIPAAAQSEMTPLEELSALLLGPRTNLAERKPVLESVPVVLNAPVLLPSDPPEV
jgi:hypothetical protein